MSIRQDVDKLDFWKKRIDGAEIPHYSVYIANKRLWANILAEHLKIIREHIKPGEKVLDAGCGYGRMSIYFDNYVGVDFSPDFISWAKTEHPDKEFMVASLKDLPFEDKSFDWVLLISIKHMIQAYTSNEEWEIMEKEVRRVGKKVLILEYGSPEEYEIL